MHRSQILLIVGLVFLALGVIGFINHPVFGVFEVNTMHNIVHLLLGGIALYFSTNDEKAATGGRVLAAAS